RYAADRYTVPAALAGLPALSVPFGKSKDGLPIGVQLMGKPLSEALLYGVGSVLEKEGSEQA
ncbi:MAG: Asp-tRNA(Asn)/Glu-tRNA(Gln) amidotransferase subunit GatA, partial [Ruminococcaceae bacterium]|nr:Asp-tRNA(Asn)/Glu-tRNA(Gln) amidotransferase subunit GatA [Oscillospiraceae bacterium]